MNPRIITATAWACALVAVFYQRALVPLAHLALDTLVNSQAAAAAPVPAPGEDLTNAEIKEILNIKGNRSRAQLLERLRNSQTPPIYPYPPCTTPVTPKTSRSIIAESWTSSVPAKTPIAATTSPAIYSRPKF